LANYTISSNISYKTQKYPQNKKNTKIQLVLQIEDTRQQYYTVSWRSDLRGAANSAQQLQR